MGKITVRFKDPAPHTFNLGGQIIGDEQLRNGGKDLYDYMVKVSPDHKDMFELVDENGNVIEDKQPDAQPAPAPEKPSKKSKADDSQ